MVEVVTKLATSMAGGSDTQMQPPLGSGQATGAADEAVAEGVLDYSSTVNRGIGRTPPWGSNLADLTTFSQEPSPPCGVTSRFSTLPDALMSPSTFTLLLTCPLHLLVILDLMSETTSASVLGLAGGLGLLVVGLRLLTGLLVAVVGSGSLGSTSETGSSTPSA